MKRQRNQVWLALRPIAGLFILSVLVIALLPGSVLPTSAHNLFQSEVGSPLPTPTTAPPTATPVPPTATSVPPTATPEPPTAEPPTPEPAPATVAPEEPTPVPEVVEPTATPEPTQAPAAPETEPLEPITPEEQPTADTVHLPSVGTGDAPEQPEAAPAEASGAEEAVVQQPPAPGIPPQSPAANDDSSSQLADFIDGAVVIVSYGWLACGVLLLLLVPVAILVFNRWGRRSGR